MSVGSERPLLLMVLVWLHFEISEVMFLWSEEWVGFITPLEMFLRFEMNIAFVMRLFAAGVFVKKGVFEYVFNALNVLEPVGFFVIGKVLRSLVVCILYLI